MSSIAFALQHLGLLERFNEELFPEHGRYNIGGRRIKCIRFSDDMALFEQDERMLKNMLIILGLIIKNIIYIKSITGRR